MAEKQNGSDAHEGGPERSESYKEAQSAFEGLNVEEKAFFLVESAFNTVLKGLQQAGDAARDAMEDALSDLERKRKAAAEADSEPSEDEATEAEDADAPDEDEK